MNKKVLVLIIFTLIFYLGLPLFSQEVTVDLDKPKASYRQGLYLSALKNSLQAMDSLSLKIAARLNSNLPEPANMILTGKNQFYMVSVNNGFMDYSISVEKSYSNETNILTETFDTVPENIERYNNLVSSIDYLGDKAGFKKTVITNKKSIYAFVIQGDTGYFPIIIDQKDSDILSGILFKVKLSFLKPASSDYKDRIFQDRMKEVIEKINNRDLTAFYK